MIRAYIALCILFAFASFSYAQTAQVQMVQYSIEDGSNVTLLSKKGGNECPAGDTIGLDATTKDGYAFDEWKMDAGGNCVIDDAHSRSTFATAYEGGLCRFRPYAKEQSFYYLMKDMYMLQAERLFTALKMKLSLQRVLQIQAL